MHAGIELNFVEFKVSNRLFGFGGVLSIILLTASLSSSFDARVRNLISNREPRCQHVRRGWARAHALGVKRKAAPRCSGARMWSTDQRCREEVLAGGREVMSNRSPNFGAH